MIYLIVKNNLEKNNLFMRNIIKKLGLKREIEFKKSEIFGNGQISLFIKKENEIENIIGITNWLSTKKIKRSDLFTDLDFIQEKISSESSITTNNIIIINKITDLIENKNYFLDILYKCIFPEGEVKLVSNREEKLIMKSSGPNLISKNNSVYSHKIGSYFFESHQLIFARIIFKENDSESILSSIFYLLDFMFDIEKMYKEFFKKEINLSEKEMEILKEISEKIKLSVTMESNFVNLVKYYKITHNNTYKSLENLFDDFYKILSEENEIDKKRGKFLFEQFKEKIMGK